MLRFALELKARVFLVGYWLDCVVYVWEVLGIDARCCACGVNVMCVGEFVVV